MDGVFYNDLRTPHNFADIAAVTLAATNKALYPIANLPAFPAGYWYEGKKGLLRASGRMTTGATPGNLTLSLLWGDATDANGTSILASAAFAMTASQTSIPWHMDIWIECRAKGPTGTLFAMGEFGAGVAVIASTLQPVFLPASAPAAVTVDLTVAKTLSLQALRSGSTAETMQVHMLDYIALN
jgi:hypothetical protein